MSKLSDPSLTDLANELDRRAHRPCRKCNATGIRSTEIVPCGKCKSTGKTKAGKRCKICDGAGHRELDHLCTRCNGTTQEQIYGLVRAAQDVRAVVLSSTDPPVYAIPPLDSELKNPALM